MADYEEDLDDEINDDNKEVIHSDENNKNRTQYVIAAHLCNKSFMYLLTAQHSLSSTDANPAQHLVFDRYAKTILHGIMPDTGIAKVSTAGKSSFKALQHEMPEIKPDITRANEATISFEAKCFWVQLVQLKSIHLLPQQIFMLLIHLPHIFFV